MNKLQALELDAAALEYRLRTAETLVEQETLATGFLLLSARLEQIVYVLLDRSSN